MIRQNRYFVLPEHGRLCFKSLTEGRPGRPDILLPKDVPTLDVGTKSEV